MGRVWTFLAGVLFLAQAAAAEATAVEQQAAHIRESIRSGKREEALRQLHVMLDRHAGDPEAEFEAGVLLQELSGLAFERLARAAPDSVQAHELLGKSYEARGQSTEALAEYRIALGKDPHAPGLHFLAGNVLWKNRDFDAAMSEFEAELRANPGHAMANARAGNIWIARGEPERAIHYLEAAVAGAPSFMEAHRDLGKAYRHAGRLSEALKQLSIVAAKQPDDDSVHAQLAAVYRAMGNPAKAGEELRLQRELLQKRAEAGRRESKAAQGR